jgi:hypothetical protein
MIVRRIPLAKRHELTKSVQGFALATFIFTATQGIMLIPITRKVGFDMWDIPFGFLTTAWPRRVRMLLPVTEFHD